jgi:hypothetical protein
MQKLLIALGLLVLAALAYLVALAYLAPGSSDKKSKATYEESDEVESEASDRSAAGERNSKEFVEPRRMRSRSSVSEDELSDPSLRKMDRMGQGGDLRSNKSNRLEAREDLSQEDVSKREQQRAEVLARRSRQWISDSDKDSDGLLSPSEAERSGPDLRRVLRDFEASDANGDGV